MGTCRNEHTDSFTHFEPPNAWNLGDFDLGEQLDHNTGTIVRWVVSIRLAKGVRNEALESALKKLPTPTDHDPGTPPNLYYKPHAGTQMSDLRKHALPRLKEDLNKLLSGEKPTNTTRETATPVG